MEDSWQDLHQWRGGNAKLSAPLLYSSMLMLLILSLPPHWILGLHFFLPQKIAGVSFGCLTGCVSDPFKWWYTLCLVVVAVLKFSQHFDASILELSTATRYGLLFLNQIIGPPICILSGEMTQTISEQDERRKAQDETTEPILYLNLHCSLLCKLVWGLTITVP